ncbi:MAG: hypothetical protein IT340_06110 [Chloroflexi bacterium]|nr:hypothetical protein [Chloroflexota bacterium]
MGPVSEPPVTPPPPPPTWLFGLTKAQWQLLAIGAIMLVPPLLFVIIILVINFGR